MSLYFVKGCKICGMIAAEAPPGNAMEHTRLYRKIDQYLKHKTTFGSVNHAYPDISRPNLMVHTKKHQSVAQKDLAKLGVEDADTEELKAEIVELKKRVFGMEQTKNDINSLTDWLMKQVEEGNVKPSLGPLVNLIGKSASINEKEIDQGISMMGLMAKYSSGEVKQLQEAPDATSAAPVRPN